LPTRAKRATRATRTPAGAIVTLALGLFLAMIPAWGTGCIEPPDRNEQAGQAEQAADDERPTGPKRKATIPAAGWNDAIAWRGLDEGLREAKQSGMPLMLVVHTDWCGNCQKLKPTFGGSKVEQLSEQFVMVHVDQDAHPEVALYSPDGQYIPRVLFLDSDGNIDPQLQNPNGRDRFRYFYTPQDDLVASMREALDRHGQKS
jgi:protein-disulfide reductase (glutathione)